MIRFCGLLTLVFQCILGQVAFADYFVQTEQWRRPDNQNLIVTSESSYDPLTDFGKRSTWVSTIKPGETFEAIVARKNDGDNFTAFLSNEFGTFRFDSQTKKWNEVELANDPSKSFINQDWLHFDTSPLIAQLVQVYTAELKKYQKNGNVERATVMDVRLKEIKDAKNSFVYKEPIPGEKVEHTFILDKNRNVLSYTTTINGVLDHKITNSISNDLDLHFSKGDLGKSFSGDRIDSQLAFKGLSGLLFGKINDKVVIANVIPNSPAAKAGLLPGMIIHSINGTDVTSGTLESCYSLLKKSGSIEIAGIDNNSKSFQVSFKKVFGLLEDL